MSAEISVMASLTRLEKPVNYETFTMLGSHWYPAEECTFTLCKTQVHGWLVVELKAWQHVSVKTLANIHMVLHPIPEKWQSSVTSLFHEEAP